MEFDRQEAEILGEALLDLSHELIHNCESKEDFNSLRNQIKEEIDSSYWRIGTTAKAVVLFR